MSTQTLDEVKEQAVVASESLIDRSEHMQISCTADLERAGELKEQAKEEIKVIEKAFKPHKDNAFKAHRDLCDAEKVQLAPFKKIKQILEPKILKFMEAEEEKRRKIQEEREKQQRLEEARQKKEAEEAKAKQVEELMDAGDVEKAEQVMDAPTPEPVAAYVPKEEPIKVEGAGIRKTWKARVIDPAKVPDMFKIVDESALNAYAKSTKGKQKVPGVEFYEATGLSGK